MKPIIPESGSEVFYFSAPTRILFLMPPTTSFCFSFSVLLIMNKSRANVSVSSTESRDAGREKRDNKAMTFSDNNIHPKGSHSKCIIIIIISVLWS